jgi:hypothetical protein
MPQGLSRATAPKEAQVALFRGMQDLGNPTTTGPIIGHRKRQ